MRRGDAPPNPNAKLRAAHSSGSANPVRATRRSGARRPGHEMPHAEVRRMKCAEIRLMPSAEVR
jgi:hypothetical protein